MFIFSTNRLKRKTDIVGAFKCDPLYLKHKNEDSGTVALFDGVFPVQLKSLCDEMASLPL